MSQSQRLRSQQLIQPLTNSGRIALICYVKYAPCGTTCHYRAASRHNYRPHQLASFTRRWQILASLASRHSLVSRLFVFLFLLFFHNLLLPIFVLYGCVRCLFSVIVGFLLCLTLSWPFLSSFLFYLSAFRSSLLSPSLPPIYYLRRLFPSSLSSYPILPSLTSPFLLPFPRSAR